MTVRIEKTHDLALCRQIRHEVFIVEQRVPEPDEWDGNDGMATHFVLFVDEEPMGTARVRVLNDVVKLERIAVRKAARGKGYGERLMRHLIAFARVQPQAAQAKLGAQVQAIPFYEKQGFSVCSDEYMDAGIPHRMMALTLR